MGDPFILEKLLDQPEALVDTPGADFHTPLHIACQCNIYNDVQSNNSKLVGHVECVQLLLEKNASVNKRTTDGQTALLFASGGQRAYSVHQSVQICNLLLDHGAIPNIVDEDGVSPLILMSQYPGMLEIVERIISLGADVNGRTNEYQTALHFALQVYFKIEIS